MSIAMSRTSVSAIVLVAIVLLLIGMLGPIAQDLPVANSGADFIAKLSLRAAFLVQVGGEVIAKMCPDPNDPLSFFVFRPDQECGQKPDHAKTDREYLFKRYLGYGWDDIVGLLRWLSWQ